MIQRQQSGRISIPLANAQIEIFNELFGVSLWSWWVMVLPIVSENEVQGSALENLRECIAGPFVSLEQCYDWLRALGWANLAD